MDSVNKLFPWIVIALGIVLISFGSWGFIGGVILIVSTMVYFYKNNRKLEFKIICSIIIGVLVLAIISLILFTNVKTTMIK